MVIEALVILAGVGVHAYNAQGAAGPERLPGPGEQLLFVRKPVEGVCAEDEVEDSLCLQRREYRVAGGPRNRGRVTAQAGNKGRVQIKAMSALVHHGGLWYSHLTGHKEY